VAQKKPTSRFEKQGFGVHSIAASIEGGPEMELLFKFFHEKDRMNEYLS